MFANYLIGLREGLEASLVVSILIAFLVKSGRRDRLPAVAGGVTVAIALSVGFGALLTYTGTELLRDGSDREVFAGLLGVVAVGFVTWMVFWMKRTARSMKRELEGRMASALALGTGAVAFTAFVAVAREGLETALFLWSALQSASDAAPFVGAMLGIATSVVIAWLLYRSAVTLNLQRFFLWTGVGLVIVAGGVLGYSVHDLQEGGLVPGETHLAFDLSQQLPPGSWYGALTKGIFNITPTTSWLQLAAHVGYIVVVMAFFLRGSVILRRRHSVSTSAPQTRVPADA